VRLRAAKTQPRAPNTLRAVKPHAPAHAPIDTLWPAPAGLHAELAVALVAVKVLPLLHLLLAAHERLHHFGWSVVCSCGLGVVSGSGEWEQGRREGASYWRSLVAAAVHNARSRQADRAAAAAALHRRACRRCCFPCACPGISCGSYTVSAFNTSHKPLCLLN